MGLGKRRQHNQRELWVPTSEVPKGLAHPFYDKLNQVFREENLDRMLEAAAAPYYGKRNSRPGLPAGVYFRMVLIGYFEEIVDRRPLKKPESFKARAMKRWKKQTS